MTESRDFDALRENMVARTIEGRGIGGRRLLAAMRRVPRHLFVPPEYRGMAYADEPLPIAEGQTISQPYVVALMAEAAAPQPGDRVLEVGAGSGYAAAVLGALSAEVFGIERHEGLVRQARAALREAGVTNVTLRTGDGSLGWPEEAPFDAIVVSAAAPVAPRSLKRQLAIGGRLVIPVRDNGDQDLVCIRRSGPESWTEQSCGSVRFVPLIGAEGWPEER